jgi:hypothetical protein
MTNKILKWYISGFYRSGNDLILDTYRYSTTRTTYEKKYIIFDNENNELLQADTKPQLIKLLLNYMNGIYSTKDKKFYNLTDGAIIGSKNKVVNTLLNRYNWTIISRILSKRTTREYTTGQPITRPDYFINDDINEAEIRETLQNDYYINELKPPKYQIYCNSKF